MMKILSIFFVLFNALSAFAQPAVDGTISSNEYGDHTEGKNQMSVNDNSRYFVTWDDTYLYFAGQRTGAETGYSAAGDAVQVFLDFTANTPVNEGAGSKTCPSYHGRTPSLPFKYDAMVAVESGQIRYNTSGTSGSFSDPGADGEYSASGSVIEGKIKWTSLGLSAKPTSINLVLFSSLSDASAGFGACPSSSNGLISNGNGYFYYTIPSTTSDKPFEKVSFTQFDKTNFDYTASLPTTLYNFTINSEDYTDNNSNDGGDRIIELNGTANRVFLQTSISIAGNIYVGPSSALFSGTSANSGSQDLGAVNTITIKGAPTKLISEGRIDCNLGVDDDRSGITERIAFDIEAGKELQIRTNTSRDVKGLHRFSSITVNTGAKLTHIPSTVSGGIELQFGTLTNNGTVDFYQSSTVHNDLRIRGSINSDGLNRNTYYFAGSTGSTTAWDLHQLTVNSQNAKLTPNTSQIIKLNMYGDLEVYRHLQTRNGTDGKFKFFFVGYDGDQYIRADQNQTYDYTLGKTTIWLDDLTISKLNGDVILGHCGTGCAYMQSFPLGSANTNGIYLQGVLSLIKGDIVTRDRSQTSHLLASDNTNRYHNFGLLDNASISLVNIGGPLSYVDGPMLKFGDDWFIFPVGKSGRFAPINALFNPLSKTVTTQLFTEYFNKGYGTYNYNTALYPNLAAASQNEFWDFQRLGSFDFIQLGLSWYNGNISNIEPVNYNFLKVAHYTGGIWTDKNPNHTTAVASSIPNTYMYPGSSPTVLGGVYSDPTTPFISFSPVTFGFAPGFDLPIELKSFTAVWHNQKPLLTWETATEKNVSHFEIEKSLNGGFNFEKIAEQTANGNSLTTQTYQYTDLTAPETATNQTLYYRIRTVDFDGKSEYTPIRSLKSTTASAPVTITPNPSNGNIRLGLLSSKAHTAKIDIFNMMGQLATSIDAKLTTGNNAINLDLTHLPMGNYTLRLTDSAGNQTTEIISIK
jgi:hypothetical protein